ncbi:MAG: hypothetical protein EA351_03740 [Gemmatimonadales bacterium]|nr:MAG: hypothetical protein EA351_03740 [Gemmatimonadales bacterium]
MTPEPAYLKAEDDPGVPDALGQALEALLDSVSGRRIETIWLFPPLRKGRREHGLLCAGLGRSEDAPVADPDEPVETLPIEALERHLLVTLAYRAEETGKGVEFGSRFTEEGEAPPDRLPVVIEGVVRRADAGSGEPRTIRVEGEEARIDEILTELGREPRSASPSPDADPSGDSES